MTADEAATRTLASVAEVEVIAAIKSAVLHLKNPTGNARRVERHIKYLKGVKKCHASMLTTPMPTKRQDPGRIPRQQENGRMGLLKRTQ
jgi:hypothetical protein